MSRLKELLAAELDTASYSPSGSSPMWTDEEEERAAATTRELLQRYQGGMPTLKEEVMAHPLAGFLPGVGDAQDADYLVDAIRRRDPLDIGIGTLSAVAPIIPAKMMEKLLKGKVKLDTSSTPTTPDLADLADVDHTEPWQLLPVDPIDFQRELAKVMRTSNKPTVRRTTPIISAVDDLEEGGLKRLLRELEKADLLDQRQLKNMFDSDGNLRMFHGTSNTELDGLEYEGLLKALGSNTDFWGGPGTYFAANWDSPIVIPNIGRYSEDEHVRILENYIPREDLDKYALTNFVSSDLRYINPGRPKWQDKDQTPAVRDILQNMYGGKLQGDEDLIDLYDLSPMATDVPIRIPATFERRSRSESPNATRFEKDFWADNLHTPYPTDFLGKDYTLANMRAQAHGLRGNWNDDSSGLAAAVFDPSKLHGGRTFDISKPEVQSDLGVTDHEIIPYERKAKMYDPENVMSLHEMSPMPGNPDHLVSPSVKPRVEYINTKRELSKMAPWDRDDRIQQLMNDEGSRDAAWAKTGDLQYEDWADTDDKYGVAGKVYRSLTERSWMPEVHIEMLKDVVDAGQIKEAETIAKRLGFKGKELEEILDHAPGTYRPPVAGQNNKLGRGLWESMNRREQAEYSTHAVDRILNSKAVKDMSEDELYDAINRFDDVKAGNKDLYRTMRQNLAERSVAEDDEVYDLLLRVSAAVDGK